MSFLKYVITLVVFLGAFNASSQKYKKERLLLLEHYQQIQSEGYYSCKTSNESSLKKSDSLDRELRKEMWKLKNLISQNDQWMKHCRSKIQRLEQLNRVPKGYSSARLDSVSLQPISGVFQDYEAVYEKKPRECEWVSVVLEGLSNKPKKSDIPYLKEQIEVSLAKKDRLLHQLEENDGLIKRKRQLILELQLETKAEEELHQFLETFYAELEKSHVAAAYEFAEKGPKGYSQAFFDEFPEFFPGGKRSKLPLMMPYWVIEYENNARSKNLESNDLVLPPAPPTTRYENDMLRLGGNFDHEPPPPPPPPQLKLEGDKIYTYVDTPAEFPGGRSALKEYLTNNIVYPESARLAGIQGTCYVQFIVSAKGNISNVEVKRGVANCPECDNETKRVIKGMPKWKPGEIEGKPVNSTFSLPVRFNLPVPEEQK